MYGNIKIAPSILSGDFLSLNKSLDMIGNGADWIHVDVMDGHFVPNITMGIPLAKALRQACDIPIDAHLMVSNPLVQIPWFIDARCDYITFHLEALEEQEINSAIERIHNGGAKAGIAIKPKTGIDAIFPYLDRIDMALVMSVEPGFSGQRYIEGSDLRVNAVASRARSMGADPLIQVDGGINKDTAPIVAKAGADVLVCGNAFFKSENPIEAGRSIKDSATKAQADAMKADDTQQ